MAKKQYEKAKTFIEQIQKKYKKKEIPKTTFIKEFMIQIGSHPEKTFKPYIKMMKATGLIREEQTKIKILID